MSWHAPALYQLQLAMRDVKHVFRAAMKAIQLLTPPRFPGQVGITGRQQAQGLLLPLICSVHV
jgi:hypothetical protein